jgi:hypothetical protein
MDERGKIEYRRSAMNRCGLVLLTALALANVACKEKCTTLQGGGCQSAPSAHCGAVIQCGDQKLDLSCEPGKTKDIPCKCIENGVEKQTVTLQEPVPNDLEAAARMAKTACGW